MNDEQLTQRMRAASEVIEMSDSAQARHLEAISAALETGAGASDHNVVSLSATRAGRRRRIVASVVAAAVIAPAGLAAASEGSIPGDALYPVKQLSERVLVLFDSDVIARHRIEEIEALETAGQFDPDLYDDARAALTELGEDHPLWERLASPTRTVGDTDDETEAIIEDDDAASETAPVDAHTVEVALPDGSEATLTVSGGKLLDADLPDGWAVTELDDDEVTLRSDEIEVQVRLLADGSIDTEIVERGIDPDDDDAPSTDSGEDDSAGEESDGDDSAIADDDREDSDTETSTPSEDEPDHSDGSDTGDDDPEDDEGDPGDDEPSEDA